MYKPNFMEFHSTVVLPEAAARRIADGCSAAQAAVICHVFSHVTDTISPDGIAKALKMDRREAADALEYWVGQGILTGAGEVAEARPETRARAKISGPQRLTRQEVNQLAEQDEAVQFLLSECQKGFGRTISPTEANMLVSLYALHGMPVEVVIMLVHYCCRLGKTTAGYIQKVGIDWVNHGVDSVEKCDAHIQRMERMSSCEGRVRTLFGIHDRALTRKESEWSFVWLEEYGFGDEMLKEAYDIAVDRTGKISFAYINSVLRSWHQKGYKTVADTAVERKRKKAETAVKSLDAGELDREKILPPGMNWPGSEGGRF